MRMLEKEFGAPRISHGGRGDDEELDEGEEDELVLGSVDAKGRLITERPLPSSCLSKALLSSPSEASQQHSAADAGQNELLASLCKRVDLMMCCILLLVD